MKILQIASGSSGNATYIENKENKILIDCGVSKKVICEGLSKYNHSLEDIDALLITHEHIDHVKGLVPFYNASQANIYLTKGTFDGLNQTTREKIEGNRINIIKADNVFNVGSFKITVIRTSHDAREPIGFLMESDNEKLVYITDTGYVHEDYLEILKNANAYIFESNHDPLMLMTSQRDYHTKIRIASECGHLSNENSAYIMTKLIGVNTKYIMLAHMSRECNTNELALSTYKSVFSDEHVSFNDTKLICLKDSLTEEIEI